MLLNAFFAARTFTDATSALHVANVLDAEPSGQPSHALRLRVLAYFAWARESEATRVLNELSEVAIGRLASYGYSANEVETTVRELLRHRLVRPVDRAEAVPADRSIVELPPRLTITASGLVHVRSLWRLKSYRAAMAIDARWYSTTAFETFLRQASAAAGGDGLTVADVQCSPALETFDAYLADRWTQEAMALSHELRHLGWVREIEAQLAARSGGELSPGYSPQPRGAIKPRSDRPQRRAHRDGGSQDQGTLPNLSVLTEGEIGKCADEELPPVQASAKYEGSVWIPRILWALEWASRHALGPLTAADIARVLRDHSQLHVPGENVARAFRDFQKQRRPATLWAAHRKRYTLTDTGRTVLHSILCDQDG